MQTPGKQVEARTPMIESRGRNNIFERLSKAEEGIVDIERPQIRMFGTVTDKFQAIDNTFQDMQDIIKDDITQRRKYFIEEQKILKEDSKNLSNLKNKLGRQLLGVAAGIAGLSQLARGNIGAGAGGIGAAAAIFSPEILGVITSVVAGNLAKSGFLNRGGAQLGTKVAGASKLKNPLLISAALAASLILPGLVSANQTADRRRQLAASRTIKGKETINAPDVDRFRTILARFDGIISNISFERKKETGGGDLLGEIKENEKIKEENNEANITAKNDGATTNIAANLDNFDQGDEQGGEISSSNVKASDTFISMGNENTNTNLSSVSNVGSVFNNQSLNINKSIAGSNVNSNINMFETNNTGGLNLAFDFLNDTKISGSESEGTNIFDLTSDTPPPTEKKFTGLAAVPSNVFVDTTGTGIDIDLIEASDALRTWAAYA
tara:strand:- start:7054 stop:8367 length:1314 start_codon:yes stop_codon:yes gene_type:complete